MICRFSALLGHDTRRHRRRHAFRLRFTPVGLSIIAAASVACRDSTAPKAARLEVAPRDTGVDIGAKFLLRVRAFDADGNEILRSSFSPSYAIVNQPAVHMNQDTVVAVSPGFADIFVKVGDLQVTARVSVASSVQ